MTEIFKGDALTVGQVKAALANVPDDVEVGQSILGVVYHVTKVDRIVYDETNRILSFDSNKRAGSFFADEADEDVELKTIAAI